MANNALLTAFFSSASSSASAEMVCTSWSNSLESTSGHFTSRLRTGSWSKDSCTVTTVNQPVKLSTVQKSELLAFSQHHFRASSALATEPSS